MPAPCSWRKIERHSCLPYSLPTPKVGRRSWPNFSIASVLSPNSMLVRCSVPKRCAGAHDGGQRLLRRDRAVDHLGAVAAEIAIAARRRGLGEISQQRLPAAARRLAQRDQRVEPLPVDPLLLVGGVAVVDLHAAQADIAHAVKRERIGRQPVAAGAADLLVIAFDIGRHIGMQHEAHIGLVDAHAERDRRHHDDAVFLQEDILVARARRRLHAGVIGQRLDAVVAQEFRQFLGLAPRAAIDDAALARDAP